MMSHHRAMVMQLRGVAVTLKGDSASAMTRRGMAAARLLKVTAEARSAEAQSWQPLRQHLWRAWAGVRAAVVDLKQAEWVLLVEGVPVSKQVLCALSIVSCELISLKPKMQMLSVGG